VEVGVTGMPADNRVVHGCFHQVDAGGRRGKPDCGIIIIAAVVPGAELDGSGRMRSLAILRIGGDPAGIVDDR
jgi:hypothetical protein